MSEQIITGVNTDDMSPISDQEQQIESQQITTEQQPVVEQSSGIDENSREGFISAVQAERDKARIEAQKAEFYKQQYEETIRQQVQPQYQQPQQPSMPKYNPDEIPDIRTVEQILDEKMNVIIQQQEEVQRQTRMNSFEAEARTKYPDYDEVAMKAVEMAKYLDPGYRAAILNANNPAEMAYMIGKQHPDYKITQEKQLQNQSTLAAIQANAQKPATLSQIKDGGSAQQQAGFYKNMPSTEWQERLARIKAQS